MLVSRAVVSDKGPGPSVLQQRVSTKTESSKASIYLEEKSTVHVDIHSGRLRGRVSELHLHRSLNYFYGVILLGLLPLASHSDLPGS